MATRSKPPAPQPLRTYGQKLNLPPEYQTQLNYDMAAFRQRWPIEKGGLPRYQHFRNFAKVFWPWMEWNPWFEQGIEALCNNQWAAFTGCAASTKTCMFVTYAVGSWLCGPDCTTVLMTSTTKGMIRTRAWPWLQRLYTSIPGERIGNFVDSKTTWQSKKGDDLNAIFAVAVKEGSTAKAMGAIQGIHNRRVIVGIDEATDTPEAIFEVAANLITGCQDFQLCAIGNAASRFDPHGKFCEPKDGWSSVSVDDEEWETVPQINNVPGICIHFDAEKSPNIIAGQTLYKYLPTKSSVEGKRAKAGPDSPRYWKYDRGFWAPEGIVQTVLTESMLIKHDAFGKHTWSGGRKWSIAFCDPAFGGGDRPVLQFAEMGEIAGGITGIQLTERILLILKAHLKDDPIHYQLSRQIIAHCKQRGVEPGAFGLDSTGEGGGLADILSREWSSDIVRVEFGGRPSERPVSNEDPRPAHEAYDRKVTEIWFTVKEVVTSGQLKGIDPVAAEQFCNRLWRDKNRKIHIEPKSRRKSTGDMDETSTFGMKERYGRSPDEADADAGIVQVARNHGLIIKLQGRTATANNDWMQFARKADEVYAAPEELELETVYTGRNDVYALDDL